MIRKGPARITFHAIKTLFKKPATISYVGIGKPKLERKYRGLIKYDATSCINCGLCVRDCPAGALSIINLGTKEEKNMKAVLDIGNCIFCCQCVDSCMKGSLTYSQDINYASTDKGSLTVEL